MYNHLLYLGYWIVNSLLLYLLSFFLPDINLGNDRLRLIESAIYAGFWLTFCVWVWWDFTIARKIRFGKAASLLAFFIINCFGLLAVSRFSFMTGFTIDLSFWIFVVGAIMTLCQRVVWRVIVGKSSTFL
ncbi:MAG: hypothetical protein HZC02_01745 [Candidatus Levybacteria bacterium]|nr:hypothetical protein [Candidatus Levybacteria bacterium]